eukprot:TRINITY_DN601_c0_g1_i1.p2 TRINITY_DN601_c0_g1~~TRINITY_DN601_c0_g1_i1.p2  ORF type:complete len:206 (+),score=55.13 TRINITY_DN601_c0_g1_i1:125-742(+)
MDDLTKLYHIRKTVVTMLKDRGYLVSELLEKETLDAFKDKLSVDAIIRREEKLTLLFKHHDDPMDQIFVFFPEEGKVGVKTIRGFCEKMKEEGVTRAVLVLKQNLTSFAKQAAAEASSTFKLEQFLETELLVNITTHQLVPEHKKLKVAEKKELLQRYKLKESQLPRIQSSDPVARYLGLERGDVVKITRPSETAGRYVTYRICL